MWPALFELPTLGEAALPVLTGIGAFLSNLGETKDPLKALSTGALSAGGALVGGRALGKAASGLTRMAGDVVDAPGLTGKAATVLSAAVPAAAIGLGQWGGGKVAEGVSNAVTGAMPSTSQLFGVPGAVANALKPGEKPYTGLYPQYSNQLPGMVSQYGSGPNVVDINNPLGQYQGQLAWQQMQNNQMLDLLQKYGEAGSAQAIKNKYADMPLELAGARARANLLLQTTMMPNAQQNAANLANTGLQGVMQSAVQRGGYV